MGRSFAASCFDSLPTRVAVLVGAVVACFGSPKAAFAETPPDLKTISRTPYHHNINLYDAEGGLITPSDEPARPYSPRTTCGKCHDVGAVSGGWHFNAPLEGVDHGRPGQPWILTDLATGSQIPVSSRPWPHMFSPEQVGLSHWECVQRFGRHMPGGGVGGYRVEPSDPDAPWSTAGRFEIDCLACHTADQTHEQPERARQIDRHNLRYLPTTAAHLAVIRGSAADLPDDFDFEFGLSLSDTEARPPEVIYDQNRFDADDRVFMPLTRRPPNQRCYFCHTAFTVPEDAAAIQPWRTDQDVHIAAGLKCTDCHRNSIDHDIVRGAEPSTDTAVAALSCRGCHYGTGSDDKGAMTLGGRLGAPYPDHPGIPPIHFDKLTCTACHSGPWPGARPQLVMTAMAHGLGLSERYRSPGRPPYIVEPVFVKRDDGVIEPRRMMWPAYWGRLSTETVQIIPPEHVQALAGDLLSEPEEPRPWSPLTSETITNVLAKLKSPDAPEPVYIAKGLLHRLDGDRLVSRSHLSAAPCSWPLGHDVRPAAQSLGVRDCKDCHDVDAPFFFAEVEARGPADLEAAVVPMYAFEGELPFLQRLWGILFRLRPFFKAVGFAAAGLVGVLLLAWALPGLRDLGRRLRRKG